MNFIVSMHRFKKVLFIFVCIYILVVGAVLYFNLKDGITEDSMYKMATGLIISLFCFWLIFPWIVSLNLYNKLTDTFLESYSNTSDTFQLPSGLYTTNEIVGFGALRTLALGPAALLFGISTYLLCGYTLTGNIIGYMRMKKGLRKTTANISGNCILGLIGYYVIVFGSVSLLFSFFSSL